MGNHLPVINVIQRRKSGRVKLLICQQTLVFFLPFTPLILSCSLMVSLTLCLSFVGGCRGTSKASIDGKRAFLHVEKLAGFGPHPSGSRAIGEVQQYIQNHMIQVGLQVVEKGFVAATPLGNVPMKNILGVLPGKREEIIMLATHYETKFFTEFEFTGANDGCSGTGLLLELATALSKVRNDLECTIWFVFFDGEEAFVQWSPSDSLYGSRYLASELQAEGVLQRVRSFILLDMVGDKDLTICREDFSTRWLQDVLWSVASEMNYQRYFQECNKQVMDDHWPFLQLGISAIDIIDFQYGGSESPGLYWHTAQDTLDKISADSLQSVGEVVYHGVFRIQKELFGTAK
ncbi:MAG: M28 family peptidase [bacterium]